MVRQLVPLAHPLIVSFASVGDSKSQGHKYDRHTRWRFTHYVDIQYGKFFGAENQIADYSLFFLKYFCQVPLIFFRQIFQIFFLLYFTRSQVKPFQRSENLMSVKNPVLFYECHEYETGNR